LSNRSQWSSEFVAILFVNLRDRSILEHPTGSPKGPQTSFGGRGPKTTHTEKPQMVTCVLATRDGGQTGGAGSARHVGKATRCLPGSDPGSPPFPSRFHSPSLSHPVLPEAVATHRRVSTLPVLHVNVDVQLLLVHRAPGWQRALHHRH
jgi:hypothetical protein